jgi:hypothetical protein
VASFVLGIGLVRRGEERRGDKIHNHQEDAVSGYTFAKKMQNSNKLNKFSFN